MNSGEYYYTIFFEPLQCCVFASICSSDYSKKFDYDAFEDDNNTNEELSTRTNILLALTLHIFFK